MAKPERMPSATGSGNIHNKLPRIIDPMIAAPAGGNTSR